MRPQKLEKGEEGWRMRHRWALVFQHHLGDCEYVCRNCGIYKRARAPRFGRSYYFWRDGDGQLDNPGCDPSRLLTLSH